MYGLYVNFVLKQLYLCMLCTSFVTICGYVLLLYSCTVTYYLCLQQFICSYIFFLLNYLLLLFNISYEHTNWRVNELVERVECYFWWRLQNITKMICSSLKHHFWWHLQNASKMICSSLKHHFSGVSTHH